MPPRDANWVLSAPAEAAGTGFCGVLGVSTPLRTGYFWCHVGVLVSMPVFQAGELGSIPRSGNGHTVRMRIECGVDLLFSRQLQSVVWTNPGEKRNYLGKKIHYVDPESPIETSIR